MPRDEEPKLLPPFNNLTEVPPPPPIPASATSATKVKTANSEIFSTESELEELILIEVQRQNPPGRVIHKTFRSLVPELQEGPTCGMVALSMALGKKKLSCENLTELAKESHWSHQGEMFSCKWMCQLAEKAGARSILLEGGLTANLQTMSDALFGGGCALVPYDKDKNHSPGLFSGKSAHWAVITGLVLLSCPDQGSTSNLCEVTKMEDIGEDQWSLNDLAIKTSVRVINGMLKFSSICCNEKEATLYVCAFQGLSRHVKLWRFQDLVESNANLKMVDPNREGQLFVPPEGISGGLAENCSKLWIRSKCLPRISLKSRQQ